MLDISDPFYNEAKYHLEVKYNFTLSFDSDSTQELVVDDTYYKLIGNIEKSLLDVKENYCKNSISLSYVLSAIIFVFCTVIYFFGAKKFFDYKKNNTKNDGSDRIEIKKDKINDDNKKTNNERYINLYNLEKNAYVVGSPVVISAGALLKDTQNDTIIVQLKMTNICNKEIKAVQIIVDGTDSFGQPVPTKEYSYIDLSIKRNEQFGQKTPVKLDNQSIRTFSVKIPKVIFSDGSE